MHDISMAKSEERFGLGAILGDIPELDSKVSGRGSEHIRRRRGEEDVSDFTRVTGELRIRRDVGCFGTLRRVD